MAKIAIIGWGIEGQSAFNYFGPDHDYLIVNEHPRDDFPPETAKMKVRFINAERVPGLTGNVADLSYLDGIESCDKIIYSVTNAKNLESRFKEDKTFWNKATTTQHLFFENVKTKNIIGVTGSKGKGTTVTLIAKMLEEAGKTVHLGGNIGRSVLDLLPLVKEDDWVVLELSNFQLYRLNHSPHIAVCLMITKEHMDWHPDMADYIKAKANLFKYQTAHDVAIYLAGNKDSEGIALASPGKKLPYYRAPGARIKDKRIVIGDEAQPIINISEVKLLGEHNLQNVCAALTAYWQVVQDTSAAAKVLGSFTGLEHRLELVRELDGVKYYDDSFGTTPDTAIVALQAFGQPKVLIVGGSDKGVPFDGLADKIAKGGVRQVIAVGQTGPAIANLLREKGFLAITEGLDKMTDMVEAARRAAKPGDVVLLSTGSASFGLFRDYKDRGEQFKAAVRELS